MFTRRSVVGGSIAVVSASELGEEAQAKNQGTTPGPDGKPRMDPGAPFPDQPEPTFIFDAPITAMAVMPNSQRIAVATGAKLFIIKVR